MHKYMRKLCEKQWAVSEWVEFNAPLDTIQVISEAEKQWANVLYRYC